VFVLAVHAQTTPTPATANELEYLQFMLTNLASPDHSSGAIKMYEDSLRPQFGLTTEEASLIHASGQSLKPLLVQFRASSQAITNGKAALTDSDSKAIAALVAQRNSQIATLVNGILANVRPETAERMRMPGNVVAAAIKATQGGK
jgi:hypothetical protein